jgi:glycosyltransferase 2 family protein
MRFIKITVSVGLLAYLARRADLAHVGGLLSRADLSLLALTTAVYAGGQILSAVKWRRLAIAVGFRGSVLRFVGYYFIGMFFNAFGLGTVGGDVVRALYLAAGNRRRGLALNTVVADRASGLAVLLGIALVALIVFRRYEIPTPIHWAVIAVATTILGGWALLPHAVSRVLSSENRIRRFVEQDLAPYWSDRRLLAEVVALSLVFHLSQIAALMILTRALGLAVPLSYCFVFGPLVNIVAAIPISLNGLGVREGGFVFFLSQIGLSQDSAIAFALAWFAVVVVCGLLGGLVYVAERQSRPTDQQEQMGGEVKRSITL